jgi:hypothetical protein
MRGILDRSRVFDTTHHHNSYSLNFPNMSFELLALSLPFARQLIFISEQNNLEVSPQMSIPYRSLSSHMLSYKR